MILHKIKTNIDKRKDAKTPQSVFEYMKIENGWVYACLNAICAMKLTQEIVFGRKLFPEKGATKYIKYSEIPRLNKNTDFTLDVDVFEGTCISDKNSDVSIPVRDVTTTKWPDIDSFFSGEIAPTELIGINAEILNRVVKIFGHDYWGFKFDGDKKPIAVYPLEIDGGIKGFNDSKIVLMPLVTEDNY